MWRSPAHSPSLPLSLFSPTIFVFMCSCVKARGHHQMSSFNCSTYVFQTVFYWMLMFTSLDWTVSLKILLLLFPQAGTTGVCLHAWLITDMCHQAWFLSLCVLWWCHHLHNPLWTLDSWMCIQVPARPLVLIWGALSPEDILKIFMNSSQKLSFVCLPAFSMSLIHKYQCYCYFIGNLGLRRGEASRLYNNYLY